MANYTRGILNILLRALLLKGETFVTVFPPVDAHKQKANARALYRSLVIRESRNISQRATVLPGEKGFRGIKIVFMECLKEPEKHFLAALGVSRLIKSHEFIRCATRKSFQRSNWEILRQIL